MLFPEYWAWKIVYLYYWLGMVTSGDLGLVAVAGVSQIIHLRHDQKPKLSPISVNLDPMYHTIIPDFLPHTTKYHHLNISCILYRQTLVQFTLDPVYYILIPEILCLNIILASSI